jgi:hypothetical protein
MAIFNFDDCAFEMKRELLEATCLHRPDTSWNIVDRNRHKHSWHADGKPATSYNPGTKYDTPSLVWVKDGEEWWEDDDEPHDVGHLECRICGQYIEPGYTSDSTRQYVPGPYEYTINGQPVSKEEFDRRLTEAQKKT